MQETVAAVAGTPSYSECGQTPGLLPRSFHAPFATRCSFAVASEAIKCKACLASDWFSLGVVAFRCLAGRLPFDGSSREAVHENILSGTVRWDCLPPHVSSEARSLLRALLNPDPALRLGASRGYTEVLGHPFFQVGRSETIAWQPLSPMHAKVAGLGFVDVTRIVAALFRG